MAITLFETIKKNRCVLCGREANVGAHKDSISFDCNTCGQFNFTETGVATIKEVETQLLPYLSIYTRQASGRREVVTFDSDNWRDIAHSYEQTPISTKTNKLLELTASRALPGRVATLKVTDVPLVYAYDDVELRFLIQYLTDIGYLYPIGDSWRFKLNVTGWEHLQSGQTQGIPGRCFVAMSFDKSLDPAWSDGIEPALRDDCKMDPIRLDLVEHNEKICDKIIAEIRSSEFLIADVTLPRPNVYFEAGFAMGLNRTVVWTCCDSNKEDIHFDTRQYNHIIWETPADLREKLKNRVLATIVPKGVRE